MLTKSKLNFFSCLFILFTGSLSFAQWQTLPLADEFAGFYNYSESLHKGLNSGDITPEVLTYDNSGTTSTKVLVKYNGKVGNWLPQNSASDIRGKVFSFNLARLLKMDAYLVGTAVQMPLQGAPVAWYAANLRRQAYRPGSEKEKNRVASLNRIGSDLRLDGAYTMFGPKPIAFDEIRRGGFKNGALRTDHPISRALNCSNSKPTHQIFSRGAIARYGQAYEDDLAKQLSNLLVVDALNLQWDRFSGSNLQIIKSHPKTGHVAFVSYDNGGTDDVFKSGRLGTTYFHLFTQWVSRFDRQTVARLNSVNDFLNGKGALDSFTSEEQLMVAMGVQKENRAWKRKWESFKMALKVLVQHVNQTSASDNCLF